METVSPLEGPKPGRPVFSGGLGVGWDVSISIHNTTVYSHRDVCSESSIAALEKPAQPPCIKGMVGLTTSLCSH